MKPVIWTTGRALGVCVLASALVVLPVGFAAAAAGDAGTVESVVRVTPLTLSINGIHTVLSNTPSTFDEVSHAKLTISSSSSTPQRALCQLIGGSQGTYRDAVTLTLPAAPAGGPSVGEVYLEVVAPALVVPPFPVPSVGAAVTCQSLGGATLTVTSAVLTTSYYPRGLATFRNQS